VSLSDEGIDRLRRLEPAWTPERAAANEVGVARRGVVRRRRRILARGAIAVTLVIIAVTSIHHLRRTAPLYADGSTARPLGADSALTVDEQTASRVRTTVLRGAYRFDVTHDERRVFSVYANGVRVDVLGTHFSVTRLDAVHARVDVANGRVRVTAADERTELTDGQSGVFPHDAPAARSAPVVPSPELPVRVEPAHARAPRPDRAWVRLAEAGDYDGAYAALDRGHVDGPADLMLAADAARLSHHAAAACEPLRRLLAEYPRDPRAPLAGFTLGRILLEDLGQPRDAATAFADVTRRYPKSTLAEDALAREVEARARAGSRGEARALAERYVSQYPAGVHVRSVRRFGGLD